MVAQIMWLCDGHWRICRPIFYYGAFELQTLMKITGLIFSFIFVFIFHRDIH